MLPSRYDWASSDPLTPLGAKVVPPQEEKVDPVFSAKFPRVIAAQEFTRQDHAGHHRSDDLYKDVAAAAKRQPARVGGKRFSMRCHGDERDTVWVESGAAKFSSVHGAPYATGGYAGNATLKYVGEDTWAEHPVKGTIQVVKTGVDVANL